MNSQITALALAGKCVGFGANGPAGAARAASQFRRSARATMPNPTPAFRKSVRRSKEWLANVVMRHLRSIDVDALVQSEEDLAIVGQGLPPDFVPGLLRVAGGTVPVLSGEELDPGVPFRPGRRPAERQVV